MTITEPQVFASTEKMKRGPGWAETIRAEERGLGVGTLLDSFGLRCARGAVGAFGFHATRGFEFRDPKEADAMGAAYFQMYRTGPTLDNDAFHGTPLERREFMARRVEVLE